MPKLFRQGDVLLIPIENIPPSAKREQPEERIVLAYGEVTGHAHAIKGELAVSYRRGNERFLEVLNGANLVHEEHSAIALPAGAYRVVQQREYIPGKFRTVGD